MDKFRCPLHLQQPKKIFKDLNPPTLKEKQTLPPKENEKP